MSWGERGVFRLWQLLVLGAGLVALGIYEYVDLSTWEAEGGVRLMGRTTRRLYELGGKGLVAGLPLVLGLLALVAFVVGWRRGRGRVSEAPRPVSRTRPLTAPPAPAPRSPIPVVERPSRPSRGAIDLITPTAQPAPVTESSVLARVMLDVPGRARGSTPPPPLPERLEVPPQHAPLPEGAEPQLLSDRPPRRPSRPGR
jgi:hypothetical protein